MKVKRALPSRSLPIEINIKIVVMQKKMIALIKISQSTAGLVCWSQAGLENPSVSI